MIPIIRLNDSGSNNYVNLLLIIISSFFVSLDTSALQTVFLLYWHNIVVFSFTTALSFALHISLPVATQVPHAKNVVPLSLNLSVTERGL